MSTARVTVDREVVSEIETGLLALVGVSSGDGSAEVGALAEKLVGLRVFGDNEGKMNRSVVDVSGSILVVSQFTLHGSVAKGRRPSFTAAAPARIAEPLIASLLDRLSQQVPVASGVFGAMMEVSITGVGPVTLVIDIVDGKVLGR